MASPLRNFAYRYRWFYDFVTFLSSLSVGGVDRLRRLGLQKLGQQLPPGAEVLDLCCGTGEASSPWIEAGFNVTGLDSSALALAIAAQRHPQLELVEGLAENPPLAAGQFMVIQMSLALHEFTPIERTKVLGACWDLLLPGGWLVLVDLHPAGPWLQIPQQLFCALFETETATEMLQANLPAQLRELGFAHLEQELFAGRALQLLTARRMI